MNKRGQFYLIAAMIIIVIITTFAVISNYSQTKDNSKIDELAKELDIESEKVLNYEAAAGQNEFEDFAMQFSGYAGSSIDIYYITGEEGSIEAYTYVGDSKITKIVEEVEGEILITIDSITYMFEIKPGENFYYIISQEINGETHIVTK